MRAQNTTYSVGIGGFRGANESGGWLRRRTWLGVEAEPAGPPTLTVPFDHLDAAPLPAFDVRVRGPDGGDGEIGHAALQLTATSPTTLRLRVSLPPPVSLGLPPAPALRVWAWADLELTRVYGVLGTESGAEGECALSNIPFAYDSLASGSLCVAGGCGRLAEATCHNAAHCALLTGPEAAINVEATPRWRAYVESTISCGLFPRPGRLAGRPEDYPWKWMWAVSPALLDYDGGSSSSSSSSSSALPLPPRGGRVTGEVGLVVSNARLAVPAVATQTMRIEVEVEATFAFLDVPDAAVGGSGGAPAARLGALNVSIALASRGGGVLLDTALAAALQPRGVGGGGLGLLRAASPGVGAFRRATMEHSDWARYSDVHGDVVLPLRQTLRVETDRFAAAVTYSTQPAHYVRLPFAYTAAPEAGDDSGAPPVRRTVSDMRAAASSAYVRIAARGAEAGCSGGSLGASAASSRDCVCAPDWDACASSPQAGADAEHARLPPEFGTLLVQVSGRAM